MKIEIIEIIDRAIADKERLWLKVLEDTDLKYYIVFDTTYTSDTTISNLQRHAYWFKSQQVKTGDYVVLYSTIGNPSKKINDNGTTTHFLYWGLKNTVWNDTGDCAVLFEINSWQTSAKGG